MLSEAPMSLPGPTNLGGRVGGSRRSTKKFNAGKTNLVGNNRRSSMLFKSNGFEHGYRKYRELGNFDWAGKSLTVNVNEEGKRSVPWNKEGRRSSIWVSKG